jgi:MFS family permease
MHALWSRWAPPLERSKLVTIAYSGSYFGTVVSMGVCGLLAEHLGWASIFYVSGNSEKIKVKSRKTSTSF